MSLEDERAAPKRPSKHTPIGMKKRAKNSALAVGYKEDLSFVVQGDMIGVFKQQREGGKKVGPRFSASPRLAIDVSISMAQTAQVCHFYRQPHGSGFEWQELHSRKGHAPQSGSVLVDFVSFIVKQVLRRGLPV